MTRVIDYILARLGFFWSEGRATIDDGGGGGCGSG